MFVTAGLMDPAGQPLIKGDEEDVKELEPNPAAMVDESIVGDILSGPPAQ